MKDPAGASHIVTLTSVAELRTPAAAASAAAMRDRGNDQSEVIIRDPAMQRLYADAARAARGRLPVLVLGETGVGKEHVAQAVHRASSRANRPLVAVNCAAIAPSLLESTLFGHERGAFTSANQRSIGVFERACGGTLFLDEVGELSASAQSALLRAIETQKVTRLGSASEVEVDAHVIAATHCDLEAMVDRGSFRQDLFFRLNGIRLDVPPLRERPDEIEPLARSFLDRACRDSELAARELSAEALAVLRRYPWPGNVRELRYAIERAALLASGVRIMPADFPGYLTGNRVPAGCAPVLSVLDGELGLRCQLRRYERALVDEALRRAGGDRQAAAKLLRIPLRTLFRKLRAYAPPGGGRRDSQDEVASAPGKATRTLQPVSPEPLDRALGRLWDGHRARSTP